MTAKRSWRERGDSHQDGASGYSAGDIGRLVQMALEQTAEGMAITDLEGKVLYANPAWATMHSYDPVEIQGQHLRLFHTTEQAEREAIPFYERIPETGVQHGEVGHVRKDGTSFPTRMTGSLLRDPHGKPVGLVVTARDVTEQKSTEEEQIQQSLARRVRQVETSTEITQEIAMAPALDELYRRVVTLIKERFGYYHVQIFRYNPKSDMMVVVEGFGKTGQKMKKARHSLPYGQGIVGTAASTCRPVLAPDVSLDPHWLPHPLLPHTRGELAVPITLRDELLGVLDVQSDQAGALSEEDQVLQVGLAGQIAIAIESTRLSEQMQSALKRVQASQQFLDTLLDSLPNPVFVKDTDGLYIKCNQAFQDYVGLTADQIIGRSIFDLCADQALANNHHQMDLALFRNPGIQIYESSGPHADGSLHDAIHNKATFTSPDGSLGGLIGTIVDITERKQIEMRIEAKVRERTQEAIEAQEALRRANRALLALSKCNQAVVRAQTETALLHDICQIVVDVGEYRLAWIASVEHDEAQSVRCLAKAGPDEGYLETIHLTWADTPDGQGPIGRCIRSRQPGIVRNMGEDPDMGPWREEALKRGYNSIIALPLLAGGEPFAVLAIYAGEVDAFDAQEVAFLVDLASSLSYGMISVQVRLESERLQQEIVEAQQRAIQELSTPVIPILERVIVMPLIGSIDSLRAKDIMRVLLAGIGQHRARVVIIDVTGVPIVDSGVANHLNKTIQAARLKGARTIVTGISDAVAETVVDLGIDWGDIETLSDLQTGLIAALTSLGIRLSKA